MSQQSLAKARHVIESLLSGRGAATKFSDSDSLFVSGALDSLLAIEVIMRLESDLGVDMSRLDFDVSLIDSIEAIARLAPDSEAA